MFWYNLTPLLRLIEVYIREYRRIGWDQTGIFSEFLLIFVKFLLLFFQIIEKLCEYYV